MTLNLIFLPLLGGYLFFSSFNGTRYRASDFPAQRIIFPSAAFGLGFLLLARILVQGAEFSERHLDASLNHVVGIAMPAAAFVVLISALISTWTLNIRIDRLIAVKKTQTINLRSFSAVAAESLRSEAARHVLQIFAAMLGGAWLMRSAFDASPLQLMQWATHVLGYSLFFLLASFSVALGIRKYALRAIPETLFAASVVLLVLTSILGAVVSESDGVVRFWNEFSPIENSGIPMLSVVLAVSACWLLNRILTPLGASAFHFSTERLDQMQRLFYESALYKQLVQINLDDNKVYVGWVRSLPPKTESADGYFLFLPLKSGYREKDSRRLHLPVDYAEVLSRMADKAKTADRLNQELELYYKVIRTESVSTAGRFDLDDFQRFNGLKNEEPQDLAPAISPLEVIPGDPD